MHEGHIKLFRRLKRNPCYQDSQYVHLWVHLLMAATWTEKRLKLKGSDRFIDLLPGQILTSRVALSGETGIHPSKIDRVLKSLAVEQQIEQQTFSKYRVISITNWREYQHSEQDNEQQLGTQPVQVKDKKKIKKSILPPEVVEIEKQRAEFFETLWGIYPKKDGKKAALAHYNASVKTFKDMERINFALGNYLDSIEGKELQFIKNGSTFFNNWQDWEPREIANAG
jgi:hypothetical protein